MRYGMSFFDGQSTFSPLEKSTAAPGSHFPPFEPASVEATSMDEAAILAKAWYESEPRTTFGNLPAPTPITLSLVSEDIREMGFYDFQTLKRTG